MKIFKKIQNILCFFLITTKMQQYNANQSQYSITA